LKTSFNYSNEGICLCR